MPLTCTAIDCPDPATHVSRRMGKPYCWEDACWADGFSPAAVRSDPRLRPEALGERSLAPQ